MKDNAEKAYEILKDKILNMEFTAGQKLREEALVGILDMSRTPIRNALLKLSMDGLVEIVPKRYSMVKKYTEEEIAQIGVARLGLDIMSANLAIHYGSNAEMYELLRLCDQQQQAVDEGNDNMRREIDCRFHLEISKISKNSILIDMQKGLYLRVRHILSSNDIDRQDRYASVNIHRAIANAMLVRDREKTLQLVKEHLFEYYNFGVKEDIYDFFTMRVPENGEPAFHGTGGTDSVQQ